jgi:hypothetical protein
LIKNLDYIHSLLPTNLCLYFGTEGVISIIPVCTHASRRCCDFFTIVWYLIFLIMDSVIFLWVKIMINVALCDLILIYTFDLILIYTFSIIIGRILYSTKLVSLQSFSLQSYSSLQDCYLIYDSFFVFLRVVYDSSNCNNYR